MIDSEKIISSIEKFIKFKNFLLLVSLILYTDIFLIIRFNKGLMEIDYSWVKLNNTIQTTILYFTWALIVYSVIAPGIYLCCKYAYQWACMLIRSWLKDQNTDIHGVGWNRDTDRTNLEWLKTMALKEERQVLYKEYERLKQEVHEEAIETNKISHICRIIIVFSIFDFFINSNSIAKCLDIYLRHMHWYWHGLFMLFLFGMEIYLFVAAYSEQEETRIILKSDYKFLTDKKD